MLGLHHLSAFFVIGPEAEVSARQGCGGMGRALRRAAHLAILWSIPLLFVNYDIPTKLSIFFVEPIDRDRYIPT